MDAPAPELYPVLVADLANDAARDYLAGIASNDGSVYVPLVAPPADASRHVLEIYTPGFEQPLRLLAEPLGGPTSEGFPLRLHASSAPVAAPEPAPEAPPVQAVVAPAAELAAKRPTAHTLTDRHERRLTTGRVATSPRAAVGRTLAGGKLSLESFVGAGGAGAVYKALHRDLRIPVAVKVLHEELQSDVDFCRRFHAEALAASRLDHSNLTRVIDFGQEPDGVLYLAMEFLDGKVLADVLQREKRLPLPRILGLMAQVCAGLAHAHARGVLHRDVKPENIVLLPSVDDDGRAFELVKVCDFGIAQQPAEVSDFAGTPEYMSPEQCAGEDLDARTDVYSCGILLYELATGALPFTGKSAERIAYHQMYAPPEPPSKHFPEIDEGLEAIIMRALSKERDMRHRDMRELRAQLRALLAPPTAVVGAAPSPGESATSSPQAPAAGEPASEQPEWMERTGAWAAKAAEKTPQPAVVGVMDPVASALVRDPTVILGQLVKTTEPHAFHKLALALDPAIRALATQREAAVLWRLTSTLDVLADEGPRTPGSRAAIAASLLRLAYDPQVLGPIAEEALLSERESLDAAWKLVVRASLGGAYALYSARLKHMTPAARKRFVRLLKTIGAPALPVMRAGLEALVPRIQAAGATDLATDLLASLPSAPDEAAGEIVATYARARIPELARAAATALPRLWGPRACSVLVGLLSYPDDAVQAAAIGGLVDIGAVDEPVARKLADIVGPAGAGRTARLAAIAALGRPETSALGFAGRALTRMLAVSGKWSDDMALAVARSLLAIGGSEARAVIASHANGFTPSVQKAVENLLAGQSP
jgi:hypothetical protein